MREHNDESPVAGTDAEYSFQAIDVPGEEVRSDDDFHNF